MTLKPFISFLFLCFLGCKSHSDDSNTTPNGEVQVAGAMSNVMIKGELYGVIDLDTIRGKDNLLGLGPMEYLRGEILILDGKSYVSKVRSDSTMTIEETFDLKAPFFVYQHIAAWKKINLKGPVNTLLELEGKIAEATSGIEAPFGFKIKGQIENATIHIVNLAKNSRVSSPEEAHKGQKNYMLSEEEVSIAGFFSTEHQGVFTHHSTNFHMHLITEDKSVMGHLDAVKFKKGNVELYIPAE